MKKLYHKSTECYQTLLRELMVVLEGVNEGEVRLSLNQISENFSIEELQAELARHYILYDGFRFHFEKVLESYLMQRNPESQSGSTEMIPSQAAPMVKDSIDVEKPEKKAAATGSSGLFATGANLSGGQYEKLRLDLQQRLSKLKNVENIDFKLDYQVDVFANEISDEMYRQIDEIRESLTPKLPGFALRINVRKDRRKD